MYVTLLCAKGAGQTLDLKGGASYVLRKKLCFRKMYLEYKYSPPLAFVFNSCLNFLYPFSTPPFKLPVYTCKPFQP
ncbi:hypothetical protein XELAEV_18041069mg [Xenopus laevis]|uniref:Uncharacterized protein n=1 Tax=Xenopus laevis TaxID=8355 RepID=A0A974C2Q3_XENLA|nr:hypothetical protein XELAEV_18041069mg [Xenopus laevis]